MAEILRRVFDPDFMPHGACYLWQPVLVWLHVLSDSLIAMAYVVIPATLFYFIRRRRDLPFDWMVIFFGVFIIACGATHAIEVWNVWHGSYWIAAGVKVVTALASIPTAVLLIRLIPHALAIPSPAQLVEANEVLSREIAARQKTERELQLRAAELVETNNQLVKAERVKTEFLSSVSHELRTPLTLILSSVESLLLSGGTRLLTAERELLKTIHNNSVRLPRMITGLLDFSRFESGQTEVRRESTEIVALTRSIFSEFQPLMQQKGLNGIFESQQPLAWVSMDRYLYERIVFNLLSNAVKFTDQGGEIHVVVGLDEGKLSVSVRDTGIGVPDSEFQNIFERFRQVEGSATRRFEGTGLGLSLVKEFANLLGGNVNLESEVGHGSTFVATLAAPGAQPAEEESLVSRPARKLTEEFPDTIASDTHQEEVGSDKPKVLLAEDNVHMSIYIKTLLRNICRIQSVDTGTKVLELLKRGERIELIIADIMMPGCDGLTLCREIKKNPATRQIPVVLLTALTHRDALLEGWRAGADEYLFKPFHGVELVTRIQSMLATAVERRRAEEEIRRLSADLLCAHDLERRSIATDLHDGMGKHVADLSLTVARLRTELDQANPNLRNTLDQLSQATGELGKQVRNISYMLHPPLLEELGLAPVLQSHVRAFARRSGIEAFLSVSDDFPRLSPDVEISLFRIVQESLTNVQRHSQSAIVKVRMSYDSDQIVLEVEDEGRGLSFSSSANRHEYGMGIPGMRERVRKLNGIFDIQSPPGRGVIIRTRLPMAKAATRIRIAEIQGN